MKSKFPKKCQRFNSTDYLIFASSNKNQPASKACPGVSSRPWQPGRAEPSGATCSLTTSPSLYSGGQRSTIISYLAKITNVFSIECVYVFFIGRFVLSFGVSFIRGFTVILMRFFMINKVLIQSVLNSALRKISWVQNAQSFVEPLIQASPDVRTHLYIKATSLSRKCTLVVVQINP